MECGGWCWPGKFCKGGRRGLGSRKGRKRKILVGLLLLCTGSSVPLISKSFDEAAKLGWLVAVESGEKTNKQTTKPTPEEKTAPTDPDQK